MSSDSWPCYLNYIIIGILVIINAHAVASKRALDYIDRNKIKDMLEDEPDNRKLLQVTDFLAKPSAYHYADHAASFIIIILCFVLFNAALWGRMAAQFLVLADIAFFIVYTALSDFLPKKIAAQNSEEIGLSHVGFQRFLYCLTKPLVWLSTGIANIILILMGRETDVDDGRFSEDKVMSMLDIGQERGEIKEEGRKMIDSIFEFDDLLAYEIMTPRTDVFMIDIEDSPSDYFEELVELTHSRIPVYRGDPDEIVGILHIKDYLLSASMNGFESVDILKLLRPAYMVPETKNIDALFKELQREKHHLAVLIDEYGGFSGIVTVEDIIEQIVGDIDDEFDEEERIINKIDGSTFIVDGNVYLDDLDDETGIGLESENGETVAGFLINIMGDIPSDGQSCPPIEYEKYILDILDIKDRRIEKVKITIRDTENTEQ